MKVKIILGTAREGRKSERVAGYVLKKARELGWEAELIDVRDYLLGYTHRWKVTPEMEKYRGRILEADALVIVAPEYNGSYPGELKILLDTIFDEYEGLPVGIVTVSVVTGGTRLLQELRLASVNYRMLPVAQVLFHNVDDLFDGEELKDEKYTERVERLFRTLERYAKALKPIRDEVRRNLIEKAERL
ncbi:NADPH-dependent FMN reductase [Thermococcus celer]|uniref:FMN reductase n=1 Tax=Thermococcus celer Vu 13 = JCM 8558 TaxID=1293037 RepID=A0A218P287_THECE|nr:NAD(P)H-dependent oxidoreductase [Thermococcus celer]ASI99039.1 FMN reductase [Thermococcus celer] [Thermococcus celer Vu 13 = JCM 8558]